MQYSYAINIISSFVLEFFTALCFEKNTITYVLKRKSTAFTIKFPKASKSY
jgi:hypothetical protein